MIPFFTFTSGSSIPITTPPASPGGGRRYSRTFAFRPEYRKEYFQEKQQLEKEAREISRNIERQALSISKKEQLEITEARRKARELLNLSRSVNEARQVSKRLDTIQGTITKNHLESIKRLRDEEAIMLILLLESQQIT